jgi:hypothetical protein
MKCATQDKCGKSETNYEKWYKFRKISSFFLPRPVNSASYRECLSKAKNRQIPAKNEEKEKY